MKSNRQGFTLVELTLAMAFVSGLLLAIALLTIQVLNIFNKGVTMSAVDRAGVTIIDEIRDSLRSSVPSRVRFITQPGGGRLCTGSASYVWNYGTAIRSTTITANTYTDNTRDIRFVKIADNGNELCASGDLSQKLTRSATTELLGSADRNIAVQAFSVTPTTLSASGQTIYAMSLTVGTNGQGQLVGVTACQAPPNAPNGDEFCAVNTFDFTARSGNQQTSGGTTP